MKHDMYWPFSCKVINLFGSFKLFSEVHVGDQVNAVPNFNLSRYVVLCEICFQQYFFLNQHFLPTVFQIKK